MTEDIRALEAIKKAEESAAKSLEKSSKEAERILNDAKEKARQAMESAAKEADTEYNSELERAYQAAKEERSRILDEAESRIKGIKKIDKKKLDTIFKRVISLIG